jgi:DNA-binding NarL/FixJ family response regulator
MQIPDQEDRVTKILLTDDEPLVLRSMNKTLQRAGFEVQTASSCPEGLKVFVAAQEAGAPFNLAILDINMPGFQPGDTSGSGLELLSRLLEKAPGLPVIMLTAYDDVARAKEAVNRGARGYFVKGREQGLVEMVNQMLNQK